jgi:predicted ester cyclase
MDTLRTPNAHSDDDPDVASRSLQLSREQITTASRRMAREVLTAGNLQLIDELLDVDFVDHNPFPGLPSSVEGIKRAAEILRTAFPDLTVVPQSYVVDGDTVVEHLESTGTHEGSFMGFPATHAPVRLSILLFVRVNNAGRIFERWGQLNLLEVMQQLGIVPGREMLGPWAPVPDFPSAQPSTPDQNKALMTRLVDEIWNEGRYEAADDLFDPMALAPYAPQLARGPEGGRVAPMMFREAFPDLHATIEDMRAEGDLVATRVHLTGTHGGEVFGIPGTGRHVDFPQMTLARVVDGRIAVTWYETDLMTIMDQLRNGPQPPAT